MHKKQERKKDLRARIQFDSAKNFTGRHTRDIPDPTDAMRDQVGFVPSPQSSIVLPRERKSILNRATQSVGKENRIGPTT